MSSDLPPVGPPSGDPTRPPRSLGGLGPHSGPPTGPGYQSSAMEPELLESGRGGPLEPESRPTSRRKALVIGGIAVGLAALVAGGFWAYAAIFATGPQPSEALPAGTVGYVSVDLDPSGKQKLEAITTLRKFPAFAELGVKSDDDLREKLIESLQDDGMCPELDYAVDFEPWLGDRMAVAAVDLGGAETVTDLTPVVVLQVSDGDAAAEALATVLDCAASAEGLTGGSEDAADLAGWSISGDWAVLAESDDVAAQVQQAAQRDPLSEDDDFLRWTDAAGGDAILTAYAAPAAADFLVEGLTEMGSFGGYGSCSFSGTATAFPDSEFDPSELEELGADPFAEEPTEFECDEGVNEPSDAQREQIESALADFDGLAVKMRFASGAFELESAGGLSTAPTGTTGRGGEVVSTLPADTAAAFGFALEAGWFDALTDYVSGYGLGDVDELLAQAELETGLALPEDIETLVGESFAVSFGSEFDPDALAAGDPSDLPLGIKVKGDSEAIGTVMDKILDNPRVPAGFSELFGYQTSGDYVVAGPPGAYRDRLVEDGGLGTSDVYRDVVRAAEDASSVFYVNFDANDWLVELVRSQAGGLFTDDLIANLEPLGALGASAWVDDDDVAHGLVRLTTD